MSVKGYLAELFDANFDRLLTPPTASALYVVFLAATTAVSGAVALVAIGLAVVYEAPEFRILTPILGLSIAGGLFLVGALASRIVSEAWVVLYRIGLNTSRLVELGGEVAGQGDVSGQPGREVGEAQRAVA